MPEVKHYDAMTVEVMQSTPYPGEMVALAMSITMKEDPASDIQVLTPATAKFMLEAEHDSVFEHVYYTFLIQGVSRSFLAQITRQRMASPTSGSQHYQDSRDYDCSVSRGMAENPVVTDLFEVIFGVYGDLVDSGMPPEEARQILPNAANVNYLWTINARSLAKFLRLRLCNRNVREMNIFSDKVHSLVMQHFPELFQWVGPQCFLGECKQGRMQCKQGRWK